MEGYRAFLPKRWTAECWDDYSFGGATIHQLTDQLCEDQFPQFSGTNAHP